MEQASHIGEKVKIQKGGSKDVLHIIDLKNIPKEQKGSFKIKVIEGAGSNEGIEFINDN